MIGRTFSHYRVLEKLGAGGMGEVYLAHDTSLDRRVAIKFLPEPLEQDDRARKRFLREARSAAALDHPFICNIHEVGEVDDKHYIVMEWVEGQTLAEKLTHGRLSPKEAQRIGIEIAEALEKAHQNGIVHRDLKPSNIMLTIEGHVKVMDFGLAKQAGGPEVRSEAKTPTALTREGTTVGTLLYMSPEQVRGSGADVRSDIFSFGVVLYELLAGVNPFKRSSGFETSNAIVKETAPSLSKHGVEVPPRLQAIVDRMLAKDPKERYQQAREIGSDLKEATAAGRSWLRPSLALPALLAIAGVGAALFWSLTERSDAQRAREEMLPQVMQLIDEDNYVAAFELAGEVERHIPNDPVLADSWALMSVIGAIVTEPPGAAVYIKGYADGTDWDLVGQSPVESLRLPRGPTIQIKIGKPGFDPRLLATGVPGFYFGREPAEVIDLLEAGTTPREMVLVPGGNYPLRITGFNRGDLADLKPFLVDRYEVTNAEFKAFVDAGGYTRREHWDGLDFVKDSRQLSWEEAMAEFVDSTGRTGPATWELGNYPEGQGNHPVTGVSWYEAEAYNRFRGKSLPTIYHWARAAFPPHSNGLPLASALVPASNFGGEGPAAIGMYQGMGPYGTFDTAGNVKEWCWNASGDHRWIMGSAWDDPEWMFSVRFTSPPFDRSPRHGFRGVKLLDDEPLPDRLTGPIELLARDYRSAEAVSDEVFEVFKSQMAYVPSALNARVESSDDSAADWVRERISFDAGYAAERVTAFLFLPKSGQSPYQATVVFGGLGDFSTKRPIRTVRDYDLDFLPRSGRALIFLDWKGSGDRWDGFLALRGEEYLHTFRERMAQWREDLGRTIDYLESREDIDTAKLAYLGGSYGASTALPLLALEDRLRVASAGLAGVYLLGSSARS